MDEAQPVDRRVPGGSFLEVLLAFLFLGCTSFGGPTAHVGYFRRAFVERRRWLSEEAFGNLLALCQILPGPTSSQLGFAIGLQRAGAVGGLAAFLGFTTPSALIMLAAGFGLIRFQGQAADALIHGLLLVAASVVGHAVVGMAASFWRTPAAAATGMAAAAALATLNAPWLQPAVILCAGLLFIVAPREWSGIPAASAPAPSKGGGGLVSAGLTAGGLIAGGVGALLLMTMDGGARLSEIVVSFAQAGALVFGGGHVVLPMLEAVTVDRGWMDEQTFIAGYGVAQALPGPLFSFAGYLGVVSAPGSPSLTAGIAALGAIFAPGLLLTAGLLPFWRQVVATEAIRAFVSGANAAVVGVLAAALWDPVLTSAIRSPADAAIAVIALIVLMFLKVPALLVVLLTASVGAVSVYYQAA